MKSSLLSEVDETGINKERPGVTAEYERLEESIRVECGCSPVESGLKALLHLVKQERFALEAGA